MTNPDNNKAMDTDISIVTTFRGPCHVYNRPYWHLASPNGFFHHNVRCGRGELASTSCAIAADPNLENAQTPYSMARLSDVKEAVFENVRQANFPEDEIYAAPRSWAERAYPKLIHYNKLDKGGHFAAWEQPQLFAEEVRAGFSPLRKSI